jgi:dienelactone hydrolase
MTDPLAANLISTVAEDGVELDGMLIEPPDRRPGPVAIWIHGFGANFYFPPYRRMARELAARGVASIVANTRGHDLGTMLQPRNADAYWGGALWERLDESPRDLAGWVDRALGAGFLGAVLIGHSLGAVKVTHYVAERQDARVLGLALTSPPLQPSWDTRAHPEACIAAEKLLADGRPEALFAGPWGTVSAQTYRAFDVVGFDQFGRHSKTPNLALVRCPVFAAVGTKDEYVCKPDDLAIIRRRASAAPRIETHVIDGADHFFTGREPDLADRLGRWINALI